MHPLQRIVLNLVHDESGEDLIEYAMAAGLVGAGAVVALRSASSNVGEAFTSAAGVIANHF